MPVDAIVDVRGRGLTELSGALAAVSAAVTRATLRSNSLAEIPLNVLSGSLLSLDASQNPLESLPNFASLAPALRELDLSSIARGSAPAVAAAQQALARIEPIRTLEVLRIALNGLTALPLSIAVDGADATWGAWSSLTQLDACNNKLESVQAEFFCAARMPKLALLNLENNELKSLPPQLGNLEHCKALMVGGNRLRLKPSLLEGGTPQLMEYLRSRVPQPASAGSWGTF